MKHILNRWRATWNPDMYHGWGRKRSYFEGWYFKIVDPTEGYALAFIPGISMGKDGKSHAFIQTMDGKKCATTYERFDASDFQAHKKHFHLQISDNQFSTNKIKINLPNIKGELSFENIATWPKMLGAPGIMGWFSFAPFMECYHGVVSLDHSLKGSLNVNGEEIDFTNGRGYIEKDWGFSFPKGYIWMQTNHFDTQSPAVGVGGLTSYSLIASVANIPWLGSSFIGYIVGFWFQNKLYRFATYTGARMTAQLDGNHIRLAFKDSKNRLEIDAVKSGTGTLISPIKGEMTGKINESLQAIINIRFFEKDKLIFEGAGRNAGLEAAGDVDILLTDKWRR
jgi:tocopherol cyclase